MVNNLKTEVILLMSGHFLHINVTLPVIGHILNSNPICDWLHSTHTNITIPVIGHILHTLL